MAGPDTIAENRKAGFDVQVEDTYEAGLALTGDEIKSIRAKRANLSGSYVKFLSGRPVLIGLHLAQAQDPERVRYLLLNAKEVREIRERLDTKGRAAVPLRLYIKKGWAKLLIGVGTGRRQYDKRELLRSRDLDRSQQVDLKRGGRRG